MAYCHVTRDANTLPDDMVRQALEEKTDIVFWRGEVPESAPNNQVTKVYSQQDLNLRNSLIGQASQTHEAR